MRLTRAKAIRLKCLDCSCYQKGEVTNCPIIVCPIYPYRRGKENAEEMKKHQEAVEAIGGYEGGFRNGRI